MQDAQPVNALYVAYVAEYLGELGVNAVPLFRKAGLRDPATIQPGERLPLHAVAALMRTIRAQLDRPDFSFELGARIPITAHGALGAALLACRNAAAALDLTERYITLVLPGVQFSRSAQGSEVSVRYEIASSWHELEPFIVEALIGNTVHNMALMLGQPFLPRRASLRYARPANASCYEQRLACAVRFGTDSNEMIYTRSQLEAPIRTANALSERLSLRQCEDELREVQSSKALSERIREVLQAHLHESPSIGEVAARLNLSERTLRRRLDEEGINFRALLQDIRLDAAKHYLGATQMHIEGIAQRLGYSETANFRKAFKQMTGESPRAWRHRASGRRA